MAEKKTNQVAKAAATDKAKTAATGKAKAATADKTKAAATGKAKAAAADKTSAVQPRLKQHYNTEAVPYLKKQFGFDNINQVPKLEKIIINMGLGDIKDNSKSLQLAAEELRQISGQKPVLTKAKKSVANFKVREGMNVGCKVTLRGDRMYEFLDRFIAIALPRVRDFRGLDPDSFDGRGNYAMGVKEQLIFPEISYDKIEKIRGFDICIVTSARTDEQARGLLKALGMPFKAD